jgi:hypothetical protein
MAPEVGRVGGHHDQVARSRKDLLLTPGTEVGLEGPIGMDPTHLDRAGYRGISAHISSPTTITSATRTMT